MLKHCSNNCVLSVHAQSNVASDLPEYVVYNYFSFYLFVSPIFLFFPPHTFLFPLFRCPPPPPHLPLPCVLLSHSAFNYSTLEKSRNHFMKDISTGNSFTTKNPSSSVSRTNWEQDVAPWKSVHSWWIGLSDQPLMVDPLNYSPFQPVLNE